MPNDGNDHAANKQAELKKNYQYTQKAIEALREKLLDLTRRNTTLNFRHSDRSRTHVRVVNQLPDLLFNSLIAGNAIPFRPLPEPDDKPKDEQTAEFQDHLEAARHTDSEYRMALDALNPDADNTELEWVIERKLRDRVRVHLGLPIRPKKDMHLSDYARAINIDPSYDLPDPREINRVDRKYSDRHIQTLLFPDPPSKKCRTFCIGGGM